MRRLETDYKVFEDVFINETYKVNTKSKPKLVIDAGANVGYSSVYFANRYPSARIIAIEPESDNYRLLKRNVGPYHQVSTVQTALWDRVIPFHVTNQNSGAWAFQVEEAKVADPGLTTTTTLNRLIAASREQFIDILKIDIEGAERHVFHSNLEWLDYVGTIVIELHDWIVPGSSNSMWSAISGKRFDVVASENVYVLTNRRFV